MSLALGIWLLLSPIIGVALGRWLRRREARARLSPLDYGV